MEIRGGEGFPPPHPVAMRGREPCSSPGQWGKWNAWKKWENGINNGEGEGERVKEKGEGMSGKRRDGGCGKWRKGMDGGGGGGKIQMGSLISGCPPPGRRPLKGKRRGGRGVKAKEYGVLALYMSRWLATKHRDQGLQLEDSSGTTDTGS